MVSYMYCTVHIRHVYLHVYYSAIEKKTDHLNFDFTKTLPTASILIAQ